MKLSDHVKEILEKSQNLSKKAAEGELIRNAEQEVDPKSIASPADGQSGAAADIITNDNGAEGRTQPGTASEVGSTPLKENAGGVDAAIVEPNKDGEAQAILGAEKEEVTKEDLETMNKAANVVRRIGERIANLPVEDIASSFEKRASAMDAEDLLIKRANEGDYASQCLVDYLTSFNLGMMKKANDMEEMIGDEEVSPEDVMAVEGALNESALENPELLAAEATGEDLGDYEGEDYEDSIDEEDIALGAELEDAAQGAVEDVATSIMEENPEIDAEEAIAYAQEIVADAIQTVDAQQAIGAMDENGEYLVNDEDAMGVADELAKTASANPLRDYAVANLNARLGLSADAFAERLFG